MADAEIRRRPGGRSARVREAVVGATIDLLGEGPAEGVTVGRVAALAGVHETSVYRRWGTRENLIIDALLATSAELLPVPDTGTLRADLLAFAQSLAAYLADPRGAALTRALTTVDPDPADTGLRRRFWASRYELAGTMVTRAIERGEIEPATEPALILEAVVAPMHFRSLITGEPIDDGFLTRLVDLVTSGVVTGP